MRKILTIIGVLSLLFLSCSKNESNKNDWQQKVKQAAEIGTVQYTVQKVISEDDASYSMLGSRKILFSIKAVIKAGVDMSKFNIDDCAIKDNGDDTKSITIILPDPEILVYNISPDNVKMIYSETTGLRSNFSSKERDQILDRGEQELKQDKELTQLILKDARQNAITFFEMLLYQYNFTDVNVRFK